MPNSLKNWLLGALSLITAVTVWWGSRQHSALAAAQHAAEQKESVRLQLQRRLDAAEARAAKAEAQFAGALKDAEVARAATAGVLDAAGDSGNNSSAAAGPTLLDRNIARLKDPQISRLLSARARNAVALRYSGLLGKLHLTPAQNSKFLDLMAEKQTVGLDTVSAANENGVTDIKQVGGLIVKAERDLDNEIRSTIGESGYTEFVKYSQTQLVRDTVGTLQQSLAPTRSPLTNAQYSKMMDILAIPSASAPAAPTSAASSAVTGFVSDSALEQAKTVLTPFQLRALKAVQNEQRLDLALRLQMTRSNGAVPPPSLATSSR
jgi:hypothetical protein